MFKLFDHSKRMKRLIEESKKREQWYHPGPWWKHPIWGDTWNS